MTIQVKLFRNNKDVINQVNDFLNTLTDDDQIISIKYFQETNDSYQSVFIVYRKEEEKTRK